MKHRKIIAVLLAVVMVLPVLTGCGRQNEHENNTDETRETDEIIIDEDGKIVGDILYNSYRLEEISDVPVRDTPFYAVGNIMFREEQEEITKGTYLFWYNAENGKTGKLTPKCVQEKAANDTSAISVMTMPDDRVGVICTISEDMGNYNYKVKYRCIEVYDENLNYAETIEVPESAAQELFLHSGNFSVDADGNYYILQWNAEAKIQTIVGFDKDFNRYGDIAYPATMQLTGLFQGGHGEVYAEFVKYDKNNGSSDYYKVYRLDAKARTCTEIPKSISPRGNSATYFRAGKNGYDFYYSDDYGIYGMKGDTSTCVMSFINSDVPVGSMWFYAPFANGDFYIQTNTYSGSTFENACYLARQRTPEDFKDTRLIMLSTVGMYDTLEEIVIAYNKQETGVRIILDDYAGYNTTEDQTLAHAKLREDLLNGIVADVVCTDGLNFESLSSKGLFADWYTLMDADEEFDRSDYLENYFKSMEYGGKLQKLGVSFRVRTALAKTEHVGETQGRTLTEMLELSDGMEPFYFYNRDLAMEFWFSAAQSSFIDRDKAQCYFNTPDFIKLLELIKTYSADGYSGIWQFSYIGEQPPLQDAKAYLEDRLLVDFMTISQPIDYYAATRTTFLDTPVTFIGYPTAKEGNGGVFESDFTLSVNAQSEEKEAVWDFMKYLLSEKYQKKLNVSLPIHKGVLDEKLMLGTKQFMATAIFDGKNVNIGAATPESMEALSEYIYHIDTAFYSDPVVTQVLYEEAEMFLAGDQSAEQAAKMMQSRVSIYLSEQS
ncbi:MAG: extracellular solute-binding protein [Oscillospiraceae bacterium]|nr:extracellular solute-binding protein [Oscillospiraceae bacterium]